MTTLPPFSSVPGQAVPGMADPALISQQSIPAYLYEGHRPLLYWDYVDISSQEILYAIPGGYYTMRVVNNRAGLTVPPPDGRWNQPDIREFAVLRPHLHEVRAAIDAAKTARGGYNPAQVTYSTPGNTMPVVPQREPERVTELHRIRAALARRGG